MYHWPTVSDVSVTATGMLLSQPEEKRFPSPILTILVGFLCRDPQNVRAASLKAWPQTCLSDQQVGGGRLFPKARLATALTDVSGSFITLELLDVVS